ncbi:hypothetical protein DW103_10050 [Parabacteroides sp. AM08-6]|nr:hypothetical protein DW103_10050 [Parabacteroides sp. AM08-6]
MIEMNKGTQMMKLKLLLLLIGGSVIMALLQYRYVFHIYFLEQLQLFLAGKEYAREVVLQPGGVIEYISEYCIQFFKFDYVGSVFTTCLLLLIGYMIHLLLIRSREYPSFIFVFECCILLFLLIDLLDMEFRYKGIIGYSFCLAALLVYNRIQNLSFLKRFSFSLFLAFLLFGVAAPFQTLFLIAASCIELKEHGLGKGKSLLPLLIVAVYGYVVNSFLGNGAYRMYVDVSGVCSLRIIPGWTKYAAWVLLPIAILLTPLLERMAVWMKKNGWLIVVQVGLIIGFFAYLFPRYDDNWSLPFKQLHHAVIQEEWEDVLAYCRAHPENDEVISLNYQNLALAEKGILADSLLYFPQKGRAGLFAPWDRTVYAAFAIQKICYYYGDVAFAQKFAFEGNVSSSTKGFPETMKMLVRTNLLQKEYRVAAKYINYLRQTFSYQEWAEKQLSYFSEPEQMEKDEEYTGSFEYQQTGNHFVSSNEWSFLAGSDKENKKLRDFVLCSFLLDKNLNAFLDWFGFYYDNTEMKDIPKVYYEGLMACAPFVPDVLTRYPIPEKIKEDFETYTSIYKGTNNPEERKKWLSLYHVNSYWFYFHYKEIKL